MKKLLRALAVTLPLVLIALSPGAMAKTNRKLSYSYDQVWPTAIRFLRVDEKFKILEKDKDTGYVLFEVEDEGKVFTSSFELVAQKDFVGRDSVEMVLSINGRPSYMERVLLNRLETKIRSEHGAPKAPPPPKKEEPKEDETPDKDAESEKNQSSRVQGLVSEPGA